MNNYTDNNVFEFGVKEESKNFDNSVNATDYDNSYLFNNEFKLDEEAVKELDNYETSNEVTPKDNNTNEEPFGFSAFDAGFESDNYENPFTTVDSKNIIEEAKNEILETEPNQDSDLTKTETQLEIKTEDVADEEKEELTDNVDSLEEENNSFDKKTEELSNEINSEAKKIQMTGEDLASLTTFEEEKVESTDIKSLFERVGVNVKEASDVFKRNTEMKEKLDSRFEELKKLQLDVARKKDEQYAEINAYKEEVLNKLTEKKEEIERRLNKLKDYQASLEKEKEEFEQYRKKEKEEIERVQKEVQEAYDSRREELNHIEDVLRRQKDLLDEERSQLSLDKIQYESDKNELANNLLKFNEIVDSFTNGIDKLDKE